MGMVWPAALVMAAPAPRPLLSPIFGDHMVLQRGKPNVLWGWARPGTAVRVSISDKTTVVVARRDGRWSAVLAALPAGGPYAVFVDAGDDSVVLSDVLVGDLWLCGGQSNMALPLGATEGGPAEAAKANLANLRLCTIPDRAAYVRSDSAQAEWRVCSPKTAGGFSAVGYYFGRKLQEDLQVPIGLIQDCVGGSPAESWMSADALERLGLFRLQRAEIARLHARGGREYGSFLMHWLEDNDPGGRDDAWAKPDFDDSRWRSVGVPGGFRDLGVADDPSIVWFRRAVVLSNPLPKGGASLCLGEIERMETAFVNGRWVGASSWVEHPRIYSIPAGVLKPGRNLIALRIFKTKPNGGFLSPADALKLQWPGGKAIPLAGPWKAEVSLDVRPPVKLPLDFDNYPTMPTVLYNGMIAPLEPLAIAGAIWYQGEANTNHPELYRRLLTGLVAGWRQDFGQGDFPFYVVGLPAFMERKRVPATDGWAELRAAQAAAVQELSNTGLATTIDTGEADNIHPKAKRPVGERLALCALAGYYRENVVASGPTLRSADRRPGALALHFDHADGGLAVHGATLGEFSVAGADGVWRWAQARIEGSETVVVSTPEVPEPVAARYAWQANPLATLFNGAGLPAAPFETR